MGNKLLALILLAGLAVQPAVAQTLIPATSEDIFDFDQQVAAQMKKAKSVDVQSTDAQTQDTFGDKVSNEAKALSKSGVDRGKDFGKWVSSQRKKTDQGRPAARANRPTHGRPDGKGKKK